MCLIACTFPSRKSHIYCPFPLSLWSRFSELSAVLSLRLQSSFCPKENLTGNSHVVHFFHVERQTNNKARIIWCIHPVWFQEINQMWWKQLKAGSISNPSVFNPAHFQIIMTLQVKKRSRKMSLFCADWLQGPWNTPQEGKWHHCEDQTATLSGRDHFRSPGLCLKRKFCFVEFSAGGKTSKVRQSRLERNISWACEEREKCLESANIPDFSKEAFLKLNLCKLSHLFCYQVEWKEKVMAPHSSTLAWKIPWTEEPGRLQFMGSLRVGHDWVTSLSLFTFMHWRRKWQPTPVFLPRESQERGSLVGCRLWCCTESDKTEVI